jgi:hypothetical protein
MNYEKCSIFSNSQEDLDVLLGQSMLGRQGQGYIPCKYQFWTCYNMLTNDSLLLVIADCFRWL